MLQTLLIAHKTFPDKVFRTLSYIKVLSIPLSSSRSGVTNSNISRDQESNINEQRELGLINILRGEKLWKTCEYMPCLKGQEVFGYSQLIMENKGQCWLIFSFLGKAKDTDSYVTFSSLVPCGPKQTNKNKTKNPRTYLCYNSWPRVCTNMHVCPKQK